MNGEQNIDQKDALRASDVQARAADILADIRAEFEVAMGSPVRVRAACDKLRTCFGTSVVSWDLDVLYALLPFLAGPTGALAAPLFDLFVEVVAIVEDPWPLLQGMLASRDNQLVDRTLERILSLAQAKWLVVDQRIAVCLAEHTEVHSGSWQNPKRLQMLARIMRYLAASVRPAGKDPLTALYLQPGDRTICAAWRPGSWIWTRRCLQAIWPGMSWGPQRISFWRLIWPIPVRRTWTCWS